MSLAHKRREHAARPRGRGRWNKGIGDRLFLGQKAVEAHVRDIFTKLGLTPTDDDHRRVLAVVAYLRSTR